MTRNPVGRISELNGSVPPDLSARTGTLSFFILSVLGFSFWFLLAVPFALHRESYVWFAMVHSQRFTGAIWYIDTTFRPLAKLATWWGFLFLNPSVFPTSAPRQAILQLIIYGTFVLAWWLIYKQATQRRLFAVIALVVGGVFFSGYVQLFHIYGIFYSPVALMIGAVLSVYVLSEPGNREVWLAAMAVLLAFWHPFATALFVGFYFGFYLDTFRQRSRAQHLQAIVILVVGTLAVAALVLPSQRTATMPLAIRLMGFLVSYQTNEVGLIATFLAFVLAQMAVFSMELSPRRKLATSLFVCALGVVFYLNGLPLLLLWLCAVLLKLLISRTWSLFFLMLTASLLPFGGGIGTPIYALFAIMAAVYATPIGWTKAEDVLSFIKPRYVTASIIAAVIVLVMVRAGIQVPIVTRAASPLIAERERTYQLENILAWLHNSDYCANDITFLENAGSPVDSVESALTRRYRPPAGLKDVQFFWKTDLQCQNAERPSDKAETAIVTFGGQPLADPDLSRVYEVKGKHGNDAAVWIRDSQKQ